MTRLQRAQTLQTSPNTQRGCLETCLHQIFQCILVMLSERPLMVSSEKMEVEPKTIVDHVNRTSMTTSLDCPYMIRHMFRHKCNCANMRFIVKRKGYTASDANNGLSVNIISNFSNIIGASGAADTCKVTTT